MNEQELANSAVSGAAAGAVAGMAMGMMLVLLAIGVFMMVCLWKIYTKAGEPGWAAIVPIYNVIILLKIVNKPLWWLLLMLIPFVNIVIFIMVYHRLSLSFGKGAGFTVGLLFLGIVFIPILA
ncbi:MAG: DUF5684 domain-containing protein, partial [Bacteroidia bacterium]